MYMVIVLGYLLFLMHHAFHNDVFSDTSTQSLLPPDSYAGIMATVHLVTNANTSDRLCEMGEFYHISI